MHTLRLAILCGCVALCSLSSHASALTEQVEIAVYAASFRRGDVHFHVYLPLKEQKKVFEHLRGLFFGLCHEDPHVA